MPKASDLKKGAVIDVDGQPCVVKNIDVKSPSSRGASTLYKVRFANLQTGQKVEQTYKGDEVVKEADALRRAVQYLYRDGEMFTFMDVEDYTQYTLDEESLEDMVGYLSDGLEGIMALLVDGTIRGVELPQSVNLAIADTPPAIKGSSATGRTKTATLGTGLEVQVPEYLTVGDVIKINTTTGKFMSRA